MSKQVEEWRPVVGYEGLYEVSDLGRVRSLDRHIIQRSKYGTYINRHFKGVMLKLIDVYGYKVVSLGKDNQKHVHRLVAEAFIPNPDNKPQVDHIIPVRNGGTNVAWNLRWVTHKENSNNELTIDNMIKFSEKRTKKVYQYTLEGELFKEWPSTEECGRNGYSQGHIVSCCNGKRKTHKGYKWSYEPL